MIELSKDVFFPVFGVCVFAMAISWIAFARLSMARIESEMQRDGLPRPCSWDGIGYRALWYAYAIVLPVGPWNPSNDPTIDVPAVRRYATPFDRKLGLFFMVAGLLFVFVGLVGGIALDLHK
ncbi:hypothetical protein DES49_0357 [Halospina denitrificans]|uniref:Uncharacterized protein n=1 Tax=Halospina denitrificans TaxID=332522 RepID=A0A4R7K2I0_9GAMM|nr:hypothetical protein [Halospina denitrificans]TDT44257.1 hypothetical protein DES49_0357 [Halospina denitrificans]